MDSDEDEKRGAAPEEDSDEEKENPLMKDMKDKDKDENKIKSPDLQLLFNPVRDEVPGKPYYEDGNPEWYTEENLKKRAELKNDPSVTVAIQDFINSLFKKQAGGQITRDVYITTFIKIGSFLRPKTDGEDLEKIVKEDFDRDTDGKPGVDFIDAKKLFDSLYELADIWCPNIDANEIVEFFDKLKFKSRYEGQRDTTAYDVM